MKVMVIDDFNVLSAKKKQRHSEEIFAAHEALWFSADSTKLAFIKFNETLVKEYKLQYYMRSSKSSYPIESAVKYPRVIMSYCRGDCIIRD